MNYDADPRSRPVTWMFLSMLMALLLGTGGVVWAARGFIEDAVHGAASREDLRRVETRVGAVERAVGGIEGDIKAIRVLLETRR